MYLSLEYNNATLLSNLLQLYSRMDFKTMSGIKGLWTFELWSPDVGNTDLRPDNTNNGRNNRLQQPVPHVYRPWLVKV